MTNEELIASQLEAVDEPEAWQAAVRELRAVTVQLGGVIEDFERRIAALEART